jgi:Kef-type K+ transport system membrane component KefB
MPHLEFSELTALLAQIAAIVFVSRALGVVTRFLGQPLVIAEVLAGIFLGPSLLGWLAPEAMTALFPAPTLPSLKMLSQVGLVLFMFLIGLELDPKLLRGRTHTSVLISHSSIVVPFGLGALVALWLYESHSSADVPLASFVLFLGVSMSVTAFPVLARILSERQLLSSRVGAIAIACAAVDDVTAWCLLALVVAVARSQSITSALWTTGFALVFIALMLRFVRPLMRRVGRRVANREGLTSTVVAGIFVLLILSSITAELIGIHALFGAFLFGAIFPKEGKLAESLIEKMESVAVVLFLPLFFAYSGLRTQIGLVSTASDWLVTGLLIAVATIGKFGGSALAGRLTGLRWREASAIGILMNTRGLMELIVLNIGLDIGVISPTVFTMLVIRALVTTFATTPVLAWVYPDSELCRDRLVEAAPPIPGEPVPYTVLMCVSDRSAGTGLAYVAATLLGQRTEPSRLLALHLSRPSDRPSFEQRRASVSDQDSPLAGLLERARDLMLDVQPLEFVSADVGKDICRTADAVQASVVLLNAHKPLLLEGNFGGTVRDVANHVNSSVGVFVDRGLRRVDKVLITVLGSAEDVAAAQLLRRLSAHGGITVTLFSSSSEAVPSPISPFKAVCVSPALAAEVTLQEASRGYDLVILAIGEGQGDANDICQRVAANCQTSVLVFQHSRQRKTTAMRTVNLNRFVESVS